MPPKPDLSSMRELTAADLVPGSVLSGKLVGKIKLVYKDDPDISNTWTSNTKPDVQLRFRITARIPTPATPYADVCVQKMDIGLALSAPRGRVARRNLSRLVQAMTSRSTIAVDATGLRVLSRTAEGRAQVEMQGGGDVLVLVEEGGEMFVLLESARRKSSAPAWDFYADMDDVPIPDAVPAAPAAAPAAATAARSKLSASTATAVPNANAKKPLPAAAAPPTAHAAPALGFPRFTSLNNLNARAPRPLSALPQLHFASGQPTARSARPVVARPRVSAPVAPVPPVPAAPAAPSAPPSLMHLVNLSSIRTPAEPARPRARQSLPTPSDASMSIAGDSGVVSSNAEDWIHEFSPSPASAAFPEHVRAAGEEAQPHVQNWPARAGEAPASVSVAPEKRAESPLVGSLPSPAPSEHTPVPSQPPPEPEPEVVEVDVEAIAIVVDDDDEEEMARLQRETEEMEEKQRKFERLAELRRRSMSARNSPALPSPIRQVNPVYVQTAAATTTINVQTVQNVNAPAKRSAETPTPPEPELKRQRVSGGTALAASSSRAMHTPKADELRRVETSGPSRASNSPTAPTAPTLAVAQRPVQAQDRPSVSDDARIRAEAERREREARTKKLEDERAAAYQKRMLAEEMEMPFTAGAHIYTPLNMLNNGMMANVMGIIVDSGYIKGSSRDYTRTLVITDPSLYTDDSLSREDTVVTVFRPNAAELEGFEAGQPVLFRGATITLYNGKLKGQLYSNHPTLWVTLKNGQPKRHGTGHGMAVTPVEYERLKALGTWFSNKEERVVVNRAPETVFQTKKERMLGSISAGDFFDATVKILTVHHNSRTNTGQPTVELYVTDGTVNPSPTRNFHNVTAGMPSSAVFCLALFDKIETTFTRGDFFFFPNLRCKTRQAQSLELNWSEKISQAQKAQGWTTKRAPKVGADDPRAKEIEARITKLQAAVRSGRPIEPVETPQPEPLPSAPSSAPDIPVSTLVFTSHTDPRDHPITPLSEALADPTVPNKYRVRARVARIEPVPSKQPSDIIITFCTRCNQEFNADKCLSCNDAAYAYAEARWRMLVFLEIDAAEKRAAIESFAAARGRPVPAPSAFPSEHAVLLADAEAAAFLPPLPVLHTGPNEMHRARAQMRTLRDKAEDLLLGNRFDGLRTRPLIDWSVAKYAVPLEADNKRGKKDKDKEKDKVMEAERAESVVLWKVFGMRTK